jgi:hypothetical protein
MSWKKIAHPSGRAVWGKGLGDLETKIMGSSPAQDIYDSLFFCFAILCSTD